MLQPASNDDRVWRALADQRRRGMVDFLAKAPRTTGSLVEKFQPLCRTAVMKHLEVLVAAELVVVRWDGRVRWNHFNPVPIDTISRRWIDGRRRQMTSALRHLKEVVEIKVDELDAVESGRNT